MISIRTSKLNAVRIAHGSAPRCFGSGESQGPRAYPWDRAKQLAGLEGGPPHWDPLQPFWGHVLSEWELMNDFLVSYLDTIDERLLEYLDDDNELSLDAVKKLRLYASSLLDGTLSPDHLAEDWADWFHLAPAFVNHDRKRQHLSV